MNHLGLFAKYNWNCNLIVGSIVVNSGMIYYKNNVAGVTRPSRIFEHCNENTHIFQSPKYKEWNGLNFIFESIIAGYITAYVGSITVPFVVYDVYNNHMENIEYETPTGKTSCLCGEIQ